MGKVRRTKTAAAHRSNPVTGSSPQEKKEKKRGDKGRAVLAQQIREQFVVQSKRSYDDGRDDSDDDDEFDREHRGTLSEAMSKKIMRVAREQRRKEILQDEEPSHRETAFDNLEEAASDEDDHEGSDAGSDRYISGDEFAEDIGEEDEHALEMLMGGHAQRRTLADMIMEKIMEKEGGASADQLGDQTAFASALERRIEPKIVEVYRNVGKFLSTYRSGKLPKAFKVLPALSDWEELLWLTEPDRWTSVSMREATRLFSSNLNPKMAQRFYNLVLLPKVRENFAEHKRLNFNLYMALKRALYKPAAFFKGILLPLCEAGDCTLREAAIIGSVLAKCSIPVLHSSVALMKIAEMRYSGANSIFMRILLNKKYSLPYKVIAAIVNHFVRFKEASEVMPVLWHRCLLVFAQRYKTDLTVQQKEHLKELLRTQNHEKISPEVRRELFYSASRGQDDMEM